MPKRTTSIAALEQALETRKRQVAELKAQRDASMKHTAALSAKIAALEGKSTSSEVKMENLVRKAGKPRTRGRGPSLIDVVVDVLNKADKPMRVSEITDAVKASGYKSNSKNLKALISAQIYKDKRIERPKRGMFQVKAQAAGDSPAKGAKRGRPAKAKKAKK